MTLEVNDINGVAWWRGDLVMDEPVGRLNVWQFPVGAYKSHLPDLLQHLSEDEIERSGRFHYRKDQTRFIIVRGILRSILSNYLGMQPRELRLRYNLYGKPELASCDAADALHFNISHSGDLAVIAVGRGSFVGVDIEQKRHGMDIDVVSNRFFSQQEILSLNGIDTSERECAFYKYWARKEAFIKALGKGVSFPLEQCDVSLLNGDRSLPVKVDGKESEWYGIDLPTAAGYAAALVTQDADPAINFSQF